MRKFKLVKRKQCGGAINPACTTGAGNYRECKCPAPQPAGSTIEDQDDLWNDIYTKLSIVFLSTTYKGNESNYLFAELKLKYLITRK